MAKKTDDAAIERGPSPFQDLERDISTALEMEAIAAELGLEDSSTARVEVRKVIDGGASKAMVFKGQPGEYDLMQIARDHGSGDYEITMRGPREGKFVIIAGPRREPVLLTPEEENALQRRREAREQIAAPVMVSPPAPQLTAADIAAAVVTALQATQRDPFEMLLKAKELFAPAPVAAIPAAPPVAPPSAMEKLTEMVAGASQLKILRGIANDFAGELGDSDEVAELLGTGGGMLKSFLDIVKESKNRPRTTPPADTGETIEGTATAVTEGEDMNMVSIALMALESAAKKNKPAAEIARQVAALSESDVEIKTSAGPVTHTMEAVLRSSQWWEVLTHFRPTLTPYKAWAEMVRAETIKIWDAQDAEPVSPPKRKKG